MFSVTPSHIIEYLFCPRFTYFEYVLAVPQNEEKYYKVKKGRNMHDEKLERNKGYLRKRIGAVEKWEDQYLTNEYMRGRIDEILKLEEGTYAPLDYKYAEWKEKLYDTYRQQLFCYAVLIEQNFGGKVNKGFIVYLRSKNKLVEVAVSEKDKDLIKEGIEAFRMIVERNFFPKATPYKRRCVSCTYRNICTR